MSDGVRRVASSLIAGLLAAIAMGTAATAQVSPGKKHDSKQPIDITSDSLEVEQDKQLATFRGKVDAIQGEIHLRADTLVVHYRQRDDSANQPGGPGAKPQPPKNAAKPSGSPPTSDPFGGGAISHIDAIGHVFVSSPDETAQGDTGAYDVDSQTIVLDGQLVILTHCENVLKGTHAVMNLDTGHSTLDVPPGQRVHGLFVPEKKGEQPGEPPPAGKEGCK
jgi:lipopolysaccharide export system protein LptA